MSILKVEKSRTRVFPTMSEQVLDVVEMSNMVVHRCYFVKPLSRIKIRTP